jgi:hypothetical protein
MVVVRVKEGCGAVFTLADPASILLLLRAGSLMIDDQQKGASDSDSDASAG